MDPAQARLGSKRRDGGQRQHLLEPLGQLLLPAAGHEEIPKGAEAAALVGVADGIALTGSMTVLRALLLKFDGLVRRLRPAPWSDVVLLCRLHALAHPASGVAELPQPAQFPLIEIGYRRVVQRRLAAWGTLGNVEGPRVSGIR
jgi:hypothetical protein